ncbi:unnamed protein product, partial [Meganyctiphanes norvegica]
MMTLSDLTNVPSTNPPDTEDTKAHVDSQQLYHINNQEVYDAERAPTERVPTVPSLMERCNSYTSNVSSNQDICRICHCEADLDSPLIAPCYCAGSLKYVHQSCLQQWIKSSDTKCCELCKFNFIMHSKIKAFNKWEKLDMSGMERRKIACSVTFHVVAVTCVVWSLYVLIERTTVEVQEGHLEWTFWTKLIVVAIGFTGGLVFMYVQCKMYMQLCKRWRAFNRVIYVQNAPEKVPLSERERCDLQREVPQQCCGGGGVKESCSESHESEKSLMGVSIISPGPTTTHQLPITTTPHYHHHNHHHWIASRDHQMPITTTTTATITTNHNINTITSTTPFINTSLLSSGGGGVSILRPSVQGSGPGSVWLIESGPGNVYTSSSGGGPLPPPHLPPTQSSFNSGLAPY